MHLRVGVITLVLALGAAGCGGCGGEGEGEPDAGENNIPETKQELAFSDWCSNVETGFANSLLESEQQCGQTAITKDDLVHLNIQFGFPVYLFTTTEVVSCQSGAHLKTWNDRFATALEAGRMTYDAEKAYACRQAGRNAPADAPMGSPACSKVLVGNVAIGAACQFHEECVDGAFCSPSGNDSCAGICQARIAEGGSCHPDRTLCELDLDCVGPMETGEYTCMGNGGVGVGEACNDAEGPFCKEGLACSTQTQQCMEPQPVGSTCGADGECTTGLCLISGGDTGICGETAKENQPCGFAIEGLPPCGPCLRCQESSETNGTGPVCVPATVGAACLADRHCPTNSFCDPTSKSCVLKARPGETCFVPDDGSGTIFPTVAHQGNCMYGDSFCKRTDEMSGKGVCTLMPKIGENCSPESIEFGSTCAEGFCDVPDDGSPGTCTALISKGGNCRSSNHCAMGLFCDETSSTCIELPAAGSACTPEGGCGANAFCDESSGLCVALKAGGEACADDAECAGGLCDDLTQTCTMSCNENYEAGTPGCLTDGAKGYSMYLIFALVLLPGLARRRHRK